MDGCADGAAAVVTKVDQITTGAGIKAGGKKRGSVCIAMQKGTSANPPLIGPLYAYRASVVLSFLSAPLSWLLPLAPVARVPRLLILLSRTPFRSTIPRALPRINVPPMNPLINLSEPLLPPPIRSKEAKSSGKGKMAANRSSVDEFIRLEEQSERKSGRSRIPWRRLKRDPRICGDNIDFCDYAARGAARVCLHARIRRIYASKVLFIL